MENSVNYNTKLKNKLIYSIIGIFLGVGLIPTSAFAANFLINPPVVGDGTAYQVDLTSYIPFSADNKLYISLTIPAPVFDASAGFSSLSCGSMCSGWGGLRTIPNYETWYITDSNGNNFYWTSSSEHSGGSFYINGVVATSTFYNPDSGFDPYASTTRFVSVTSPANFATKLSTTVTFSGTYYINPSDISNQQYDVPPYLQIIGESGQLTGSTTDNGLKFIIRLPVSTTTAGNIHSFSTTTTLSDNTRYTWDVNLNYVASSNGLDTSIFAAHTLSSGYGFFQFTTGNFVPPEAKVTFDLSHCNPLGSFDAGDCLKNLIVPSPAYTAIALGEIKGDMATIPPWGYVTRIIDLISTSTATTSLPVLSYTFQSDSPFSGKTLTFDVSNYMAQAKTLSDQATSNTDHKNVWQILGPIVNTFFYLILVFAILQDLGIARLIHHKR